MTAEVVLIIPQGAAEASHHLRQTPFGPVVMLEEAGGILTLIRTETSEARALIYAAKESGACRVLAADTVQAVSGLLEPGDLVVPGDLIDLTRLRPFTFFVGKGYGFIRLDPPFCPDLMAACLAAARQVTPRAFGRGVYVGVEGPREVTPAELRMYRQWGGDVAGTALLPEAYLARELELCYGAVTVVGRSPQPAVAALRMAARTALGESAGRLPCTCGQTMRAAREQGLVAEDWRGWITYPGSERPPRP